MFSGIMLANPDMLEMVTFLCEKGAGQKQEALKYASEKGYVAIAEYLIKEQHADPVVGNDESSLSLLVKAFNFITSKIAYSDKPGPISLEDVRDIHKSIFQQNACKAFEILDLVKEVLLSMPEDQRNITASHLLRLAVQNAPEVHSSRYKDQSYPENNFFNMVDVLLECGGDVNASSGQSTPFQQALIWGSKQMVAHLLDKGAELHKGGEGIFEESAYKLAMRHGRPDIKDIILNHLETHPDDQSAINSAAGDFLQQDEFMKLAGDNTQISHMPDEPAA